MKVTKKISSKNNKISSETKKEVFLIISSFIVGGIVMLGLVSFTPLVKSILGSSNNYTITQNGTKVYEKSSLSASVEKIYDAVVLVEGYDNNTLSSTGTGFVYKIDNKYAYILTNEHVISSFNTIKIMNTKDEETEVKVLGKDEYLDLAVLRVDKKYASLVATIGSSEDMSLGDTIFTVGSPLGSTYRGSVTSGVLSGKDRMVSVSVSTSSSNDWVMRVLQIDASINPGNSGGPLLNVNGEVIGICSMKLVDDEIEGMGFAIPIEYAMNHVDSLEKGEEIKWPVLGISMINLTDQANINKYNIKVPDNVTSGIAVVGIKENTSAAKSDLKVGDIITKIDDNNITDISYLRYELYQHKSGDTIEVTYLRNGKEKTTKIKLISSN
jgi:serine protease Do